MSDIVIILDNPCLGIRSWPPSRSPRGPSPSSCYGRPVSTRGRRLAEELRSHWHIYIQIKKYNISQKSQSFELDLAVAQPILYNIMLGVDELMKLHIRGSLRYFNCVLNGYKYGKISAWIQIMRSYNNAPIWAIRRVVCTSSTVGAIPPAYSYL